MRYAKKMERYILMHKNKSEKKAQVWSLDLLVSVSIFIVGIVILFFYAINFTNQTKNNLDNLYNQGYTASEILLSEDEGSIVSNGIINQTKLDEFFSKEYEEMRRSLGMTDNFYFTLDDLQINGEDEDYIGLQSGPETKNLVKINRIVAYRNKPSKLQMYIWK